MSIVFPEVNKADANGLLAVGGRLTVETLLMAYSSGIFPWPIEGFPEIPWFAPPLRGVLFFEEFHLSRSFKKFLNSHSYTVRMDSQFADVIRACAEVPRSSGGTWITEEMIDAYTALHEIGYAHSVECYSGSELVGGLYGVAIGHYFSAESMFYRKDNASKLCILYLVERLAAQGVQWLDCQQVTPATERFGVRNISREYFMDLHGEACGQARLVFA